MPNKPKAVLVIGLQEQGNNEIKLVQATGYQLLLFKQSISFQEVMEVDVPVEIDLNQEEAVIEKARQLQEKYDIAAVYTLNEYRIPLAARMKEALGIAHGLSYEAALNCRNKKRTREALEREGVGSAQYRLVQTPDDALAALQEIPLPVIIKPSNEAGSHLVARCDTPEEVVAAVQAILHSSNNWVGQQMDRDILLEEYLEGPEFSVEACTVRGETTVFAITEKSTQAAFEVGHLVPAPLQASENEAIAELVKQALAALCVTDTVTHTEVKLTAQGPKIIEVNARPGGDRIPQLVLAITGYELRELSLHLALGGTLQDAPRHAVVADSAAIRFFVAEEAGTVALFDPREAEAFPAVKALALHVKDGAFVEQTTSNYNRLGYFIVHGEAGDDVRQLAEQVSGHLRIRITPATKEGTVL